MSDGIIRLKLQSPSLFNLYMDGVTKQEEKGYGKNGKMCEFLYAEDLILCVKSGEYLRKMIKYIIKVYETVLSE